MKRQDEGRVLMRESGELCDRMSRCINIINELKNRNSPILFSIVQRYNSKYSPSDNPAVHLPKPPATTHLTPSPPSPTPHHTRLASPLSFPYLLHCSLHILLCYLPCIVLPHHRCSSMAINQFILYFEFMKKLQNPTTFFFKQAENPPDLYRKEIEEFVSKLLDKDHCPLCKKDYSTETRLPRIMIHCGHTFCTPCLAQFYINRRIRCPMCLKLVKQIDSIDRIPINHTIYAHLVQKETAQLQAEDASVFLFGEFERVQKEAHMQDNPQKIDPDSGMPFCVFHNDRVEHFYCEAHKISGCRVCIEIGHSKADCSVLDLYNVPDPQKYLSPLEARIEEADVSEPLVDYYKNGQKGNKMFNLDNEDEDDDLVDDSDEEDTGRKSV